MKAKITYYGVRGSTPTSGSQYATFGGNTTCVSIETESAHIILDAGTGIRNLGNDLMNTKFGKEGAEAHLFFTHTHWDHIQGFPFFIPAYLSQNSFHIYGETKAIKLLNENGKEEAETWDIERTLYMQQNFMYFPASTQNMGAKKVFHEIGEEKEVDVNGIKITSLKLYHPNDTLGYRITLGKKVFVFCTDVEHNAKMHDKIAAFAEGADALAYDCQYTPEEYENGRKGWGHSTYEHAADIVKAASAKSLHMIHHDPAHDDKTLKDIEAKAKKLDSRFQMTAEKFSFEL